ncbi:MAG: hypothetical protein HY909_31490 [Deltaproteobacteria bacterium]|nr:hypothetical protein [Deltaproteobacteria bacterium]
MNQSVLWFVVGGLLASCGSGVEELEPGDDSLVEESGTRRDDPRYTVAVSRQWVLKGDGLTAGDRELTVRITPPAGVTRLRASVDSRSAVAAVRGSDGVWTVRLAVDALAPGEHTLKVGAGTSRTPVVTRTFQVSHPAYVVVSTDFDDTRFSDREIARMDELRRRHPRLVYSHFFAPFHYTDPQVSEARKAELERWVKAMRDEHGDELGVHIHGWCHFVTAAGVRCRTEPAFAPGDTTGYLTVLAAYTEAEMTAQLRYAVEVFQRHGLGRPTSFRAGGWTADLSTLRALEASGYTVDSSAMPPHRIASWRGYNLYTWNERNWTGITETSQPYFPSEELITRSAPMRPMRILEVPDNGILVDYITGQDMVAVYEQNAPTGRALRAPALFQVGFHPPNFSDNYLARMDMALAHVDRHLHAEDRGPAVYARISDLTRVWRP